MNEDAKIRADRDDERILEALQSGKSFLVEAGAGAGKTYSLKKVIDWLQDNKRTEYQRKKQKVICITFTNAAVDVISGRLKDHSFIEPTTIHTFAWQAISQYQEALLKEIQTDNAYSVENVDMSTIVGVCYDLGHRTVDEDNKLHLHHNDIISLFAKFLDKKKFRDIFSKRYPLILIDEYQDSSSAIVSKFKEYFISQSCGPQFGFFGDAWQTIYQSNKVCGEIQDSELEVISKGSNFRSAPQIVDVLNKIRPKLKQIAAIDDIEGEVVVVTCDDYTGLRRNDKNFKNDLPQDELSVRINTLKSELKKLDPEEKETIKTLFITHRVLAVQQGYDNLLNAVGNQRFTDLEEPVLEFVVKQVEPAFNALATNDIVTLSEVLGRKNIPIRTKQHKRDWKTFYEQLQEARNQTIFAVLTLIKDVNLVPIPPKVADVIKQFKEESDQKYCDSTYGQYLNICYNEFASAAMFFQPESVYSTEHGVKGEEYDNVIFGITKGWFQYDFPQYAPMIPLESYPEDKKDSYIRNRNLFYVCCSRPKKRLIIFISVPVDATFKRFLVDLVGESNYYTYSEYIDMLTSQN